MKYSFESELIWENYLNPKEGGLPLKADMEQGMPFSGSPAPGEDCEVLEPGQEGEESEEYGSNELEQIQSQLNAISEQAKKMLESISKDTIIPGFVQSKIALANANITEAAQYMTHVADTERDESLISIQMVAI